MPNKKGWVSNVKDSAEDFYDSAKDRVIGARDKTSEIIQENPFKAVVIAAAVGAAVAIGVEALLRTKKKGFFGSLFS